MPKCGTKNALFGYFGARILESYSHIWNQHLWTSIIVKFCEETKMPKFETKNALFGHFWPKMPYLGIFGLDFEKGIARFDIPWNLSVCKISRKKLDA